MTKKLTLIAIALLAIAPFANAGFFMSPTGDVMPGNVAIQISAAGIDYATYLAVAIQGTGTLGEFAKGPQGPANTELLGTVGDFAPQLGQGEIWAVAHLSATPVYTDGIWLTANLIGGVEGDVVTLYETLDGSTFTELSSFTVVPEPITVALLGLGGLFVARKNKK